VRAWERANWHLHTCGGGELLCVCVCFLSLPLTLFNFYCCCTSSAEMLSLSRVCVTLFLPSTSPSHALVSVFFYDSFAFSLFSFVAFNYCLNSYDVEIYKYLNNSSNESLVGRCWFYFIFFLAGSLSKAKSSNAHTHTHTQLNARAPIHRGKWTTFRQLSRLFHWWKNTVRLYTSVVWECVGIF